MTGKPVFDSNVWIEYDISDADYDKMLMSSVVLHELTSTTLDEQTRQFYQMLRTKTRADGILITPTEEDWWETAKIVSRWRFSQKRAARGKTPKLPCACEPQNDALIGYTAWKHGGFVVTSNLNDFRRFKDFWKARVVSAEDYFGF